MDWISIKTVPNLSLAELDKQLLKEENIPVLLRSGGAAAYMGAGTSQEVMVPEKYVQKARKILEN
jgi:hypothetical protein